MQHYWLVIKRGLIRRCPQCGKGQIFSGYLNLMPECLECGESFRNIRSDDAAPWATVLFVGHLAAWIISYLVKGDVSSMNLILIVLIFVITFPLALDEDTEVFSDFDESPSIYGNVVEESPDPNDNLTIYFKWRLGVAPLLILLSGVIALISFYDLKVKNSGEINTSPIIVNAYEINTDTNIGRVLVDEDEKIENAPQKTNKKEVSSLADELKKLSDLKEQGILDEEEFMTAKRKLMENL